MKSQDVISWRVNESVFRRRTRHLSVSKVRVNHQQCTLRGQRSFARYLTDKSIGFEEVAGDLFLSGKNT